MARKARRMLPTFNSDESRSRYLAAYNAALGDWPVPYAELDIATTFGATHVIACGAKDAPPLLLLPSFAASATSLRLAHAENVTACRRNYGQLLGLGNDVRLRENARSAWDSK